MPLKQVKKKGKTSCWKFGSSGKTYCGSTGRKKAAKQGRAIEASKTRRRAK